MVPDAMPARDIVTMLASIIHHRPATVPHPRYSGIAACKKPESIMRRITAALAFSIAVLALVVPAAQQKFKVSTASVPVYVTVTDQQTATGPGSRAGRLRDPRQREASERQHLREQADADHHHRDDRQQWQHDGLPRSGEGRSRAVPASGCCPRIKAQVGAFNDKIEFHPATEFTSDRDAPRVVPLKQLDFGYPTRLYDAVDESLARLENLDGRRVVLVFTDGDDTASKISSGHVMDRARAKDVMVYAIGLVNEYFNGQHAGAEPAGPQPEEARRRYRRRLFRAEEDGGPERNVHAGCAWSCTACTCSASHPRRSMARSTSSTSE